MRFGLTEDTIDRIKKVFSGYRQIDQAIIYGSRAKGNFRNGSDIDIVLKGKGLHLSMINKILLDLDELMLPYTFDVSNFEQISNGDVIEHINRVGRIFYEKDNAGDAGVKP